MGALAQLGLLLWKNYLVQRRQLLWTIFEILIPCLLSIIMVILRQQIISTNVPPTRFEPFKVDGSLFDLIASVDNQTIVGLRFQPDTLLYAPDTQVTRSVMNIVQGRFQYTNLSIKIGAYKSEDLMVNDLMNNFTEDGDSSRLLGGIVFDDAFAYGYNNDSIRYAIRLANSRRNDGIITDPNKQKSAGFQVDKGWDTNNVFPRIEATTGPRERTFSAGGKPGYWREGFLTLQRAVDIAITVHLAPNAQQLLSVVDVRLQRFPYPAFVDNPFIPAFQRQFPVILLISLIMSVLYITRNVVQEKEQRLKEYMKVMGLSGWLHWWAHFITNFVKLALAVAVITLILCIDVGGKKIVERSDPTLIFVYLLLYAACTVWYSFAVSTFFHNGNSAAAFGGIFWFLLYIPYFFLQPRYGQLSMSAKIGSCFALNTAVAWGAEIIGIFESHGTGLRWSNLFDSGVIGDSFSMAHVMLMLLVNLFMFVVITWYVEAINPGDQGVPHKLWFPFLPSYWFSRPNVQSPLERERERVSSSVSGCDSIEGDPPGMDAQITIRNLGKVWTVGWMQRLFDKLRGKKTMDRVVAVSGLSVRMFPGQVTALLGHNGAGKSTTLSMLCGLVPPTSGSAVICGYDICDSLSAIRKHLGLCPQYNCLFDNLTVDEHLILFCKLKNRPLVQPEVNHLLSSLGLTKKRKALSKTLSGGMKRKLSVAIALIGGSEIVFLDEPTSGMDPGARHEAWTLLQEEKKRRTIVLTTHYMEEADLLGDRIAILARGRLQCCGSGLFLKNFYGTGYHLTMVFDKPTSGNVSTRRPMAQEALAVLQRSCKHAQLESSVGMEATFTLPYTDREKFEALFAELELNQSILGVASFGVSITTMEEVFLKVGHIADDSESDHDRKADDFRGLLPVVTPIQSVESETNDLNNSSSSSTTSSESIGLGPIESSKLVDLNMPTSKYGAIDQSFCGQIMDIDATFWTDGALAEEEAAYLIPPHEFQSARRVGGLTLFWQQLYAMLVKRALHSARNWLVLFAQLVIPVFFVLVAIIINQTLPKPQELPPLSLNLRPFGSNVVSLQRRNKSDDALIDGFASHISTTSDGTSFVNVGTDADFSSGMLDFYSSKGEFDVNRHYILGIDANVTADKLSGAFAGASVVGYFNNQPYHSPAIILNSVDNALLRLFTNSSSKSIETVNHPLPPTSFDQMNDWLAAGVVEYNITFNLLFGFAFLASTFVVFLIKERETKAKHLQFLSGVHPANFWLATFIWDFVNYLLPALAILLLWVIFGVSDLVDNGNWMTMLLLLVTYGWSTLPMMYTASFMFSSPASGFVKMTIFNIFSGLVTLTVNTILLLVGLEDTSRTLDWVFLPLFPNYCLGDGIQVFYVNEFVKRNCLQVEPYCAQIYNSTVPVPREILDCCYEYNWTKDSLRWAHPGIGRMPFFMGVQGFVFWFIVFLIEADVFRRVRYALSDLLRSRQNVEKTDTFDDRQRMYLASGLPFGFSEDEDVVRERNRVVQLGTWSAASDDAVLVVNDLTKNYGDVAAVRGLHFAVDKDECFGLLGVNGAGKTSTFRMLTGEELISGGSAIVSGIDVKNHWRAAGPYVGYCPQFDAVIEQLTGEETLRMFARLRAIPARDIELLVQAVVRAVGIERHAARQVKTYSGGNKRRLSLGIALVGLPKVLLLDEPTTGVDPGARRAIWDILAQVRNQGTAIILTSHSMEECEALCTRLAIMVDGQFKCFGSPQHLKSKYGSGFSLQLKVESIDMVEAAKKAIPANFPGSILKEVHYTQLAYELPSGQGSSWSRLFGAVEKLIEPLKIVDYSLSQTTLERVFLDFSRLAFDQSSLPYSPTASDGNSSGSVEFV